jgi:hypothetical protein
MVFSLQAYQSPGRQHLSHWAQDLRERFNILTCTSMRDHILISAIQIMFNRLDWFTF